jgi:hypothetical protein
MRLFLPLSGAGRDLGKTKDIQHEGREGREAHEGALRARLNPTGRFDDE